MGFGAGMADMEARMALAVREGGLVSRTTWSLGPIQPVGGFVSGWMGRGGEDGVAYCLAIRSRRLLAAMMLLIGRIDLYLGF